MIYLIGVPSILRRGDRSTDSTKQDPIIIELPNETNIGQFMADYEIGLNTEWEEENLKKEAGLLEFREGKYEWEYRGKTIEWIALFEGERLEHPSYWDDQQTAKKFAKERHDRMLTQFKNEVIEQKRLTDVRLVEEREAREKETYLRLKEKFEPITS